MITVYTSITNNKDPEIKHEYPITRFVDAYDKFVDPRRNSRAHKILSTKYLDSEYTIYLDGNIKLLISPEEVIKRYMDGYDMAMFKHGVRDCIYDEAIEVAKLGLDNVEFIIEQAKHYEDSEYPKHNGLLQGGFIVRRNNERVKRFEEAWFADYCRYSRRDQLSLMPAIKRSKVLVNRIEGTWKLKPNGTARMLDVLEITSHKHFEGNFNESK